MSSQLGETSEFYRRILEQSRAVIIAVVDARLDLVYINESVFEVTGYSHELFLNRTVHWNDIVVQEDLQKIRYYHRRRSAGDKDVPDQYEVRIVDRNGLHRNLVLQVGNYLDAGNLVITLFDISHWKRYEERLLGNEEKLKAMVELSREITLVVNESMTIEYAGGAVVSLLGYRPEALNTRNFRDFIHSEDIDRVSALFLSGITEMSTFDILDFRLRNTDDEWVHMEANCNNQLNNHRISGVIVTLRDISARKVAEEKAQFYEHYDYLTRLPNRRMFFERLGLELRHIKRRSTTFAVLCFGVDRFKEVNDLFGPKIGDRLLVEIGKILSRSFRKDDSVSRLEGDKFGVLVTDVNRTDHVLEIVKKILEVFKEPIGILGERIRVSVSIGVAVYPDDGFNEEMLVKNSETALFMAKERGKSTYQMYNRRLHSSIQARRTLERQFEQALGGNEFHALFQPKVDRKGRIIGAEALARWNSPELGQIPPDQFIPVAESSGLIIPFGREILDLALREWQRCVCAGEGEEKPVLAVNLSPFQFGHPDLVRDIQRALEKTGFDPALLELEITETGIMRDQDEAEKKLLQLNEMGVSIAIDDFGTGYSSLKKIKDFPVGTIKIDKSFLENLNFSRKSSTIINAIIGLSHDLGFSVVAEGVETLDQLEFLQEAGCNIYQGYLFDKPLAIEELASRFTVRYYPVLLNAGS
ncbi:putative bifunctional diguanylate cyclase/phosphodiesterase [Marispirochaeta aestuarii]|uniref:putative bifunctional diguanylate cyclase/phosphodiesterase n=1 Tax=Marispirochaeta aestuarii TaxID=1963862 RepID=UPI001301E956|nr:bifunctional diguanylate cyclase/phosphodiesterase [Marispirochaeta aestuarii]